MRPPRVKDLQEVGLHRRVLHLLGRSIAGGAHGSGSVLRIEELEVRFRVSRTVIREAARVLESMQLVELRRGVGITVRPMADWNIYDPLVIRWRLASRRRAAQLRSLTELRVAIEPVAASLAADRATPQQCGDLTAAVIGLVATGRSGDLEDFLQHDIAFHSIVLVASGNEMFARLAHVVAEILTGRTVHGLMPAYPAPRAITLHATVAEAIRSRDARRAEEAMRGIVVGAMTEMEPQLGSVPPASAGRAARRARGSTA